MRTLDVRTRTPADIRTIDVGGFFNEQLPRLFREHGDFVNPGAREFNPGSLTIDTESGAWTLTYANNAFQISKGASGNTAIKLNDEDFQYLVNDLSSVEMQLNLKQMKFVRGSLDDLHCWEAILRSVIDARPLYTAGSVVLRDRGGQPLDLNRAFTPEDDDEDILHFLQEAGFLHLSGWLDEALMDEIATDMDRAFTQCTRSDGSWWATMADGTSRPVRVPGFTATSAAARRLIQSEPYLRLSRLTNDGYTHAIDVEALQKPIGVVAGISDIPWHKDCATGMHSYVCRHLTVGISVTGAGPGSAQLGVIPGSHRALMPANRLYAHTGLKPLFLTTKTGDMTVHCSCLLHCAKPPKEYERKVLYTGFSLPKDPELEQVIQSARQRRDAVATGYGHG